MTPAFVQRSADDEDMAAARREYDARMTVLQPEAAGQEVRDFGTVDRLYWDSGGHEAGYKHPYPPLTLALLKRPKTGRMETRPTRILPQPLCRARPTQLQLEDVQEGDLPSLGVQTQPLVNGWLPGLEPSSQSIVPVLPLEVAQEHSSGRGASMTARLWFLCQMALHVSERDGKERRLRLTLREIVSVLWPNAGWKKGKDLPLLRSAMRRLYELGVHYDRAEWLLVRPVKLPTCDTRLDDTLLIDVTSLPGSETGPLIDTAMLWDFGARGGVPWRAWIRLAYLWDTAKAANGGKRVYDTRPEVLRTEDGTIIDQHGRPVIDQHGKPVKKWNDSRAILTGHREPNPSAERVPLLDAMDLAILGYDASPVPPQVLRERAKQTREWLRKMERLGAVKLESEDRSLRILQPWPCACDRCRPG